MRNMLVTKALLADLPKLYEGKGLDALVVAKYFTPDSNWTWYVTEGNVQDDNDILFYGLACGFEKELGNFMLSELATARGPRGLKIERDLYWTPISLREVMQKEGM